MRFEVHISILMLFYFQIRKYGLSQRYAEPVQPLGRLGWYRTLPRSDQTATAE